MIFISFDPAVKSLASSILYYNENYLEKIYEELDKYAISRKSGKYTAEELIKRFTNTLKIIAKILRDRYQIRYLNVTDLLPGISAKLPNNEIIISKALYSHLLGMDDIIRDSKEKKHILIEYQMKHGDKNRTISHQILYHFLKYSSEITIVKPKLKNTVHVGDKMTGGHQHFVEKYSKRYTANKAHSKCHFLRFLKELDCEHMIKDIKKKNIDDIADTIMMSLYYSKLLT